MVSVALYGVTQEERRQIVRDSIPVMIECADWDWWSLAGGYHFLGYDALPEFYEILKESIEDREIARAVVNAFVVIDGYTWREGEREALDWTRKIVLTHSNDALFGTDRPLQYFVLKGDATDSRFLKENFDFAHPMLEARVGGTNLFRVGRVFGGGWIDFIPSVTNMGPQAVYVHEIIKRFWEQSGRDEDISKIPEALLTMVVSFDGDGNPVSSVDLAKYGLSMPILTGNPNPYSPQKLDYTVTFPHDAKKQPKPQINQSSQTSPRVKSPTATVDTQEETEEASFPLFVWLCVIGIGIILGVFFLRQHQKRNKNSAMEEAESTRNNVNRESRRQETKR